MEPPALSKDLTEAAKAQFPGPGSGMFARWMDAVRAAFSRLEILVLAGLRTDAFTATNGQTLFALSQLPSSASGVLVFVNGQRQIPGFDFNVAGAFVTWIPVSFALEAGDSVLITYT